MENISISSDNISMKKSVFFLSYLLVFIGLGFSQGLSISPSDLRLEPEVDFGLGNKSAKRGEITGYHLFVKKLDGMESVMITESAKDPDGKVDNYAYRALEYNDINGDEIRYLDGKVLNSKYSKFSLIDSTAEKDSMFGYAFHIYIPLQLQFGYPWSRNGLLTVGKSTYINIRAYSKKYGDYSGSFNDNPFLFDLGKNASKTQPLTESLVNEVIKQNEKKRNNIINRLNKSSSNTEKINIVAESSSAIEESDVKSERTETSENEEAKAVAESSSAIEESDAKSERTETSENEEAKAVAESSSAIEESDAKSERTETSENEEAKAVAETSDIFETGEEGESVYSEKSIILGSEYYNKEASESFSKISGSTTFSLGPESIVGDIMKSVNSLSSSESDGLSETVGVLETEAIRDLSDDENANTLFESENSIESSESNESSTVESDEKTATETENKTELEENADVSVKADDSSLNTSSALTINTEAPVTTAVSASTPLVLSVSSNKNDKKNKKNEKKSNEVESSEKEMKVDSDSKSEEIKKTEEIIAVEENKDKSSEELPVLESKETEKKSETTDENVESVEKPVDETTDKSTEETTEGVEQEIESTEVTEASKKKDYSQEATDKFTQISENLTYSHGPETIVNDVAKIFTPEVTSSAPNADIVFVIDATGSMVDDIDELRKSLIPQLESVKKHFKVFRVGLVLYRDYGDDFAYYGLPIKVYDFASDLNEFRLNLNDFIVKGSEGGDIPEAVYEGLYGALALFQWDKTAMKKIILIGDAEPHPKPRGVKKISQDLVQKLAKQKGVQIDAIITPDGRIHK